MTPFPHPRLPDWPTRLQSYLVAAARRPFVWGQFDCILFGAGAVAAMTGVDPAATWRGTYRTPKGAARVLTRAGFADVAAPLSALFPAVSRAMARPGDLALFPVADGLAVCVVGSACVYVLTPHTGLALQSKADAAAFFKVI